MAWKPVSPQVYQTRLTQPVPEPEQVFAGPGYSQPRPESNPLATAALTCGIIGILLVPVALFGVILGHIAGRDKYRTGVNNARAGYGLGYASIAVWGLLFLAVYILFD